VSERHAQKLRFPPKIRGLSVSCRAAAPLARVSNWDRFSTVVDVGGGHGSVLRDSGRPSSDPWPLGRSTTANSPGVEDLPVGTLAPEFDLPGIDGTRVTLSALVNTGHPAALVFVYPGCEPFTDWPASSQSGAIAALGPWR
jgi:hypothetical protein